MTDHDEPTPYQGVAEMRACSGATSLCAAELRQVIDEDLLELACRADGPVTHDPEAVERMQRYFDGLDPEWQALFSEIDRRDQSMDDVKAKRRAAFCEMVSKAGPLPHSMMAQIDGCPSGRPWAVPVNYDVDDEPTVRAVSSSTRPACYGPEYEPWEQLADDDEPSVGDVAEAVERAR